MFQRLNLHCENAGYESERQLVRATITGCDAIWEVTPNVRIFQFDPIIHVAAPLTSPQHARANEGYIESQFEALNMLCGHIAPELGGGARYLDILGANFYHRNQWEIGTNLLLWWYLVDPRRIPPNLLLVDLYERYHRPLLLGETSHVDSGRGVWIREMASEVSLAKQKYVDFRGICIYPTIDRPDCEDATLWHRSCLGGVGFVGLDPLGRILSPPYALALRQAQKIIEKFCLTNAPTGCIFVQGYASPNCNPPGGFGPTGEITYSPWKPLPVDGSDLIARCVNDCIAVGMLLPDYEVLVSTQVDIPMRMLFMTPPVKLV